MPPLDLDTLSPRDGGGGGGAELKAALGCDTALSDCGSDPEERDDDPYASALSLRLRIREDTDWSDAGGDDDDPYAPAQSHRLRIGEDIHWSDVGAVAARLERDDSTKGAGANPKCAARRSVASAATAARCSVPPAPAPRTVMAVVIGGLPVAAGKTLREHGMRRSPCRLGGRARRVFAAGEAAAAADPLAEPGSPKVSCLGGVRSQPRSAAEGVSSSGRGWWAWLVADAMSCCCWSGRRERRRPKGSEAE